VPSSQSCSTASSESKLEGNEIEASQAKQSDKRKVVSWGKGVSQGEEDKAKACRRVVGDNAGVGSCDPDTDANTC
jgi:hypothetical protein